MYILCTDMENKDQQYVLNNVIAVGDENKLRSLACELVGENIEFHDFDGVYSHYSHFEKSYGHKFSFCIIPIDLINDEENYKYALARSKQLFSNNN